MDLISKITLAAIVGLVSHHVLYIRGEWHIHMKNLLEIYTLISIILVFVEKFVFQNDLQWAARNFLLISGAHNSALWASMCIYRLFFHRLHDYPGPNLARVTKFWHVWQCLRLPNNLVLDQLHRKYGQYVRTGPNELTIFDPAIVTALQDNRIAFTKPPWYDLLYPYVGIISIRDRQRHSVRRRIWDYSFNGKAIADYESRIMKYAEKLEAHIALHCEEPFVANDWFYWLSFDVMGDLTFAKSLRHLEEKRWHSGSSMIRRGMSLLGIATPVPWLAILALQVPVLRIVRDWMEMQRWCRNMMLERLKNDPAQRDISSAIIKVLLNERTTPQAMNDLVGDAITLILAGSDTVALTLTHLFYRLARHPSEQSKLRDELDGIQLNCRDLKKLPHLNALIYETLRLHPPIPTGGLRQTPEGGVWVNERFLPGDVTICVPQYSMARLEECFIDAEEFIPDRWTTRPELVKNRSAFAPFGTGKFDCIGKSLGLSELAFVAALLVSKYKVAFAEGDHGTRIVSDARDDFVLVPGRLRLKFSRVLS